MTTAAAAGPGAQTKRAVPACAGALAEPPLILQGGNVSCIDHGPKLALVWRAEQAQGKGCAGQELSLPFIMEAIGRRRLCFRSSRRENSVCVCSLLSFARDRPDFS